MDDDQLLRDYATHRSEAAFCELVRRHGRVVHGVARRQAGIDAHLADDVTQRVFLALARKAPSLRDRGSLVGWLYLAARLEAARVARSEARRRERETKAGNMDERHAHEPTESAWDELKPVLDEAMARLGEPERQAILLRFFSGCSFAEVGAAFQTTEEAARKRVERAMARLREILRRRGVVSTSAALGSALSAHAAPPLGESTLATIAAGACQQAAAGSAFSLGFFMSSTKFTLTAAGVAVFLAAASMMRDHARVTRAHDDLAAAQSGLAAEQARRDARQRDLADVRRERADAEASEREFIRSAANPLRPYLQDPAYRAAARAAQKARRHLGFQRLYRQLGLSPAQMERFEEIMVRQDEANLDAQVARDLGRDEQAIFRQSGPEWSGAMKELLGADGFRQLQVYLRTTAVREFLDTIAARSYESSEPITLEQSDRLAELALAHDPTFQQGKGTDPGKVSWNEVWDDAAKFLTPGQLVTFETAVEVWSLRKRISLAQPSGAANP